MRKGLLSGADLDPYKVPALTACWWCGCPGPLTREHKFKKTDIVRMWDIGGGPVWGNGTVHRPVKSARKSQDIRFDPGLCGPCNNDRSQPFDEAYRAFSDYVWDQPQLWRATYIDMAQIYGTDWPVGVRNLARYVAKHLGSRMAHERFPVPPSLVAFLDGAPYANDVQMVLFKSREHYYLYCQSTRDGLDGRGLWIAPGLGMVSSSQGRLTLYSSSMAVGFVGVFYRWEQQPDGLDPFYDYQHARLHWRHKLPEV